MFERIKLPYEFDALEPYIDAETMFYHYQRHYKNYTDTLNTLLEENNNAQRSYEWLLLHSSSFIRHNAGGWWNHTFFFNSLTPGGRKPTGKLIEHFPNIEFQFKDDCLVNHKTCLYGSGYLWLVVSKMPNNCFSWHMNTTNNQEVLHSKEWFPILNIDMWEHAHYLKHKNDKDQYIKDIFNVVDWNKVSQRYDKFLNFYTEDNIDARYEPA